MFPFLHDQNDPRLNGNQRREIEESRRELPWIVVLTIIAAAALWWAAVSPSKLRGEEPDYRFTITPGFTITRGEFRPAAAGHSHTPITKPAGISDPGHRMQPREGDHSHYCPTCKIEWWHGPDLGEFWSAHSCPKCGRRVTEVRRFATAGKSSRAINSSEQMNRDDCPT